MTKKWRRFICVLTAALMLVAAVGCNRGDGNEPSNQGAESAGEGETDEMKNPEVTITMEDGKEIVIELLPEMAPNTVNNFISLINQGYYDGLTFHRLVPGFVIQGGCPLGNGTGDPGYSIKGEFATNGFDQNTLTHERGIVSMARSNSKDSAGSQFFIVVEDSFFLDDDQYGYGAFGRVKSGMDVADELVQLPNSGPPNNAALEPPVMKSVTVDTFGVDYPEPEKIA